MLLLLMVEEGGGGSEGINGCIIRLTVIRFAVAGLLEMVVVVLCFVFCVLCFVFGFLFLLFFFFIVSRFRKIIIFACMCPFECDRKKYRLG